MSAQEEGPQVHFSLRALHERVIEKVLTWHGEPRISEGKLLFYAEQVGDETRTIWPISNVCIYVHNYLAAHYPLRSLWWGFGGSVPVWVVFAALRACNDPPWAS